MKRQAVRVALGLLLLLLTLGHATRFIRIEALSRIDALIYDARIRLDAAGDIDPRVVIVDIDEKSLAELGRWPWPRNRVADLVDRIFDDYGARLLGLDIVFAERDESSGWPVLADLARGELSGDHAFVSSLKRLRPLLDYDARLAEAIGRHPVVLGYYFSDAGTEGADRAAQGSGALPPPAWPRGTLAPGSAAPVSWQGYGANLRLFQDRAEAGHFNPLVDFDGVVRRVPLVVGHGGEHYDALSLAMVRNLLGRAAVRPGYPEGGEGMVEWLEVAGARGCLRIPVDPFLSALVPYRGPQGSFPYVSAADVLAGRAPADLMRGRIVLLGTTAPGLFDLRVTPVGEAFPGVEIQANLVAGLLDGRLLHKPGYAMGVEVTLLLVVAAFLGYVVRRLAPWRAAAAALAASAAVLALSALAWREGLLFPVAGILALIVLLYVLNVSLGFFSEARSKRQFAERFEQYVPPELVAEMSRDPEKYSMEGRSAELTLLFSDVRGFTHIAESMPARDLAQMMNVYLGAMTSVIRKRRGTLDKYIGDAIMAFWGAPLADPLHARQAVLAALEMQAALAALGPEFARRGWPCLHAGIGINTGTVTVGDMGSEVRKAYTAIGDAVNLASRLEGLTKAYGVGILVGEATRSQCADLVFREVDRVRVVGRGEAVTIYEPLGTEKDIDAQARESLNMWSAFLERYRAADREGASALLAELVRRDGEHPLYAAFARRLDAWSASPPVAGWDGVQDFDTK